MVSELTRVGAALALTLALSSTSGRGLAASRSSQQVALPAAQPTQSDQRTTFRSDVTYVEIPATVIDRQGRFVTGLMRDDFEVFEDGQRQAIGAFRFIEFGPVVQPTMFAARPDPDVASNESPFDGRIYVIVLDDLHTDPLKTGVIRSLARRFVQTQVGADDLAAVVFMSGVAGTSQDLTSSQTRLLGAIDRFVGGRIGSLATNGSSQTSFLCLRLVVNTLAEIRGRRKAVILFSGGIPPIYLSGPGQIAQTGDVPIGPPPKWIGLAQSDLPATIAAAIQANTTIYAVNPDGLTLGDVARLDPPLETLRRLSWDTGGQAAVSTNNLNEALDRIGEDNSRYYLLGYYPATPKQDGRFHRIEVRVRKPGVDVRARTGYYARKVNASSARPSSQANTREPELLSALQDALNYPTPLSGVRLRATAAPFRNADGKGAVTVVVQLEGRDIGFSQVDGRFNASVNLAIVAVDSVGEAKATVTQTYSLPLLPDSNAQMVANGLRLVHQLYLPKGPHRLHIVVQDALSRKVGTVNYDVEVPNFGRTAFTMSGLLLTSNRADATPSAKSDRLGALQAILPGPPTVARTFSPDESLTIMAEVYDRGRTAKTVDVTVTVKGAAGVEVSRHDARRTAVEMKSAKGVDRFVATVPLSGVAPGRYVLMVEASSGGEPQSAIRRELPFEIVTAGAETRR